MYIEPRTNVRLLHNVPLENTYDHTLYFADAQSQYSYFANLTKKNCVNYTYQRVNKGRIRVEGKADNYYDCNYMMFQNTSFGNKWFYAFINSVEYINNETTEIEFEIDVMQTWFFDSAVEECFIERQHSWSDAIGDNIVPESLECGEYVFNNYNKVERENLDLTNLCIIVAIVNTEDESEGTLYDGIYGGATLFAFDAYSQSDIDELNAFITLFTEGGKPDAILSIYMIPKNLIGTIPADHHLSFTLHPNHFGFAPSAVTKNDTLNGYLPKNGKMYTYPYNYLHVDNANGSNLTLRYEFFGVQNNVHQPMLVIDGVITQPVAVALRPTNYKGVGVGSSLNPETVNTEMIQINNYPICSWNVDSYNAWIAQNAVPTALNTISNISTLGLAGVISKGIAGPLASGVGAVSGLLGQMYSASIQADVNKGNFNNGGVNVTARKNTFYYGRCSVNYQYAKMIDDYFTMYGYAIKSIGRINTHSRPHWNYVKTVGCVLTGSIPSDDARKIVSIYDRGITFWKNGNEVGNYELDNRPS